jgi:hypothetical protein
MRPDERLEDQQKGPADRSAGPLVIYRERYALK